MDSEEEEALQTEELESGLVALREPESVDGLQITIAATTSGMAQTDCHCCKGFLLHEQNTPPNRLQRTVDLPEMICRLKLLDLHWNCTETAKTDG